MTNKEAAKKRAILLKRLREEHKETVTRTQALLKEQKAIRRQICQHMREAPKAVPEIAEKSGIAADQVLWHVTAMKKFGLVIETGMCGEYYLYQYVA
jgi:predicted transcriptional regulator